MSDARLSTGSIATTRDAPAAATPRTVAARRAALLIAAALLPLVGVLLAGGGYVGHPGSELPVRLWCLDRMPSIGWFGGYAAELGHPTPGLLNNPDVFGTAIVWVLRPALGLRGAWNAMVALTLLANLSATFLLAKSWLEDEAAAMTAALGVGWMPLALTYGVGSSIVDMLHLWPYAIAVWAVRRVAVPPHPAPIRDGALGGLALVAALVASPYAFVVALSAAPLGGLVLVPALMQRSAFRAVVRGAAAFSAVAAPLAIAYALTLDSFLDEPTSQVSSEHVAPTRNAPPWDALRPEHPTHFVARLAEYVSIGRGALLERDTASHYMRTNTFTLTLAALATMAAVKRRDARVWALLAVLAAVASTGPFLALTGTAQLGARPMNPLFFYVFLAPGGSLVLETFRYGFVACFAAAMAAGAGVAWLRSQGGWVRHAGTAAPALFALEVLLVSPVPFPLPVNHAAPARAYASLSSRVPPGAIVELPFTYGEAGRFARIHFLNQLVHRRAVADVVRGWPPDLYFENDLLALLVAAEALSDAATPEEDARPRFRRVRVPAPIDPDMGAARAELIEAGFVAIVIDPSGYASPAALERVVALLGPGVFRLDDRLVYPLTR